MTFSCNFLEFSFYNWFLLIGLVSSGVKTILEIHPTSFLYPVVFATLKSSGFMIVKYCEQVLLTGLSKAFVLPHHATKTMVVAACLLTAQKLDFLSVNYDELYCGLVAVACFIRLTTSWVFKVSYLAMKKKYSNPPPGHLWFTSPTLKGFFEEAGTSFLQNFLTWFCCLFCSQQRKVKHRLFRFSFSCIAKLSLA